MPTALARVDPTAFRTVLVGGQAPPPDRPANVIATYGLTETGSGIAYDGVPLDGVEIRIVDDEIHVRGPMLLRAYRDGDDPKDADGWLPTGDAGSFEDGRLSVHGRIGDLIITGGENVWPVAVERVLAHPPRRGRGGRGRPARPGVGPAGRRHRRAHAIRRRRRRWTTCGTTSRRSLPAYAAPKALELVDVAAPHRQREAAAAA